MGVGKTGVGEMGVGKTGVGEMGVGKTGVGDMEVGKTGVGDMGVGKTGVGEMELTPCTLYTAHFKTADSKLLIIRQGLSILTEKNV